MYFIYILQLNDHSYYIGSTQDIDDRLRYHNQRKVRSTKNKLPAELIYKEQYQDRSAAQRREYQIKSWKSRRAIEKLLKSSSI